MLRAQVVLDQPAIVVPIAEIECSVQRGYADPVLVDREIVEEQVGVDFRQTLDRAGQSCHGWHVLEGTEVQLEIDGESHQCCDIPAGWGVHAHALIHNEADTTSPTVDVDWQRVFGLKDDRAGARGGVSGTHRAASRVGHL